jgi:hypothetical protein
MRLILRLKAVNARQQEESYWVLCIVELSSKYSLLSLSLYSREREERNGGTRIYRSQSFKTFYMRVNPLLTISKTVEKINISVSVLSKSLQLIVIRFYFLRFIL